MENSFKNLIEESKSILILLPGNPNLDQVASGLSLYLGLKDKKDISISCPTPMVVEFNRLVGVDKISPEAGNKNLVIKFKDYQANDIERVSYDIENGQFKLSVIPKPGLVSPKKDQLEISYSGVAGDTIILIGGTSQGDFPALSSKEANDAKIIHVGKNALQADGGKSILSFARPGSSVSEICYSLISEVGQIDSDIATNLLAGIEDTSENFAADGVTAETFEIVAHLIRSGGKRPSKVVPESFPQGALPGHALFGPEFPEEKEDKGAPDDWLQPKVYKGTSIS